ncbi:MAG: ribonuclease P protein component [Pirellulaceae bacterium]|nr:ribonuclease P protein component [Pirellulaceae bacterium]HJN07460.1 ribonuclease P protein component [Pirellulaceae bacterium]
MNDHANSDNEPDSSLAFPKSSRVRKQADFDRAHRQRAYAADDTLVLRGCPNGLEHARLGLSVSRKVGNAVVRNRWKRLIREAFRMSRAEIPRGMDFVVRPRKGAVANLAAIEASLPQLCWRLARLAKKEKS